MGEQSGFLRWNTPGEDAVKIVKVTAKDLAYYLNLDKAKAVFERI